MPKQDVAIQYYNRDFTNIKGALVDYARRYFPETFKDFSEASFGAMMVDMVAYMGDILSFYLDWVNQIELALVFLYPIRLCLYH